MYSFLPFKQVQSSWVFVVVVLVYLFVCFTALEHVICNMYHKGNDPTDSFGKMETFQITFKILKRNEKLQALLLTFDSLCVL